MDKAGLDRERLVERVEAMTAEEAIHFALDRFHPRAAFASSFGAEDIVVMDLLLRERKDARIFTLDTGRLHEETHEVALRIRERYGVGIESFFPDRDDVEGLVRAKGPFSFRENVANRKECCAIRKVAPLTRALSGLDLWITGLRRSQAMTRATVSRLEWDESFGLLKLNPIADWSEKRVWDYIRANDLPYNALHDRGFPSVGCAPCTRAVSPGEDVRAGRWWWEQPEHRECGLHGRNPGRRHEMTDTPNESAKVSKNELLKEGDPTLGGSIATTLGDASADRFSADDNFFLKFHGIYQQDDRDLRKTGKTFIFMVRCRIPGGVLTPEQYLACDDLATRYANQTLRVTSRQGLQFHGVVKTGLGPLVKSIHESLLTTLAACGDVSRNVMAPASPPRDELGRQVRDHAKEVAEALAPTTSAYHAIWVDGVPLKLDDPAEAQPVDPLYGKTYLPRKFKLAFVIPPRNDVDVLTNCCGFVAIPDAAGALAGYVLTAGGGMGRSHANEKTFPRLADAIGLLPPERVVEVARGVLGIHRDFGDRGNRKHARLKYVLEDRGPRWFRDELERRIGFSLSDPPPFRFDAQGDALGWHDQADGRLFLGVFVETGRIRDLEHVRLKAAIREAIATYRPEVRLTPSNNMILAGIEPSQKDEVTRLFAGYGVKVGDQATVLRRGSMACVALPTCGLAVAESERVLPALVERIETVLGEVGLGGEEILVRMTGCPNGCARPYTAEIGFVGRSLGLYEVWLGGNDTGTRLNRIYKDNVKDTEIVGLLRPLLARYAQERGHGERFGDWCARSVWDGPSEGRQASA